MLWDRDLSAASSTRLCWFVLFIVHTDTSQQNPLNSNECDNDLISSKLRKLLVFNFNIFYFFFIIDR